MQFAARPESREEVEDRLSKTLVRASAIPMPLFRLPSHLFPIFSQEDLELKLLGRVTKSEPGDQERLTAAGPPAGHQPPTNLTGRRQNDPDLP